MVLGYVWWNGTCGCLDVLQARYQVRTLVFWLEKILLLTHCSFILLFYYLSIQNWALEEAKARMEARGEKTEYP